MELTSFRPNLSWVTQLTRAALFPRSHFQSVSGQSTRKTLGLFRQIDLDSCLRRAQPALFIWIPKTAGTSVAEWLSREASLLYLFRGHHFEDAAERASRAQFVNFGHMTPASLVENGLTKANTLDCLHSFVFVRNPVDRVYSLYRYAVMYRAVPRAVSFELFLRQIQKSSPRPGLFHWAGLSMSSPMVRWVHSNLWSGPRYTYKVEEIELAVKSLKDTFEIPGWPNNLNASPSSSSATFLSKRAVRLIKEIYWEDFVAFGYRADDSPLVR